MLFKWRDGLAGSTAAGGFLESGGRLVYAWSFCLTYPGECSLVTLRLCECQLSFPRCRPGGTKKNSIHRQLVGRCLSGRFAADEATPRFMALVNDFCGIFLVLGLAGESELVLGLAIRDFVDTARIGEKNSVGRAWHFGSVGGVRRGGGKFLFRTGTIHSWRARGQVGDARRPQCRSAWMRAGPVRRRPGLSSRSRPRRGGP